MSSWRCCRSKKPRVRRRERDESASGRDCCPSARLHPCWAQRRCVGCSGTADQARSAQPRIVVVGRTRAQRRGATSAGNRAGNTLACGARASRGAHGARRLSARRGPHRRSNCRSAPRHCACADDVGSESCAGGDARGSGTHRTGARRTTTRPRANRARARALATTSRVRTREAAGARGRVGRGGCDH